MVNAKLDVVASLVFKIRVLYRIVVLLPLLLTILSSEWRVIVDAWVNIFKQSRALFEVNPCTLQNLCWVQVPMLIKDSFKTFLRLLLGFDLFVRIAGFLRIWRLGWTEPSKGWFSASCRLIGYFRHECFSISFEVSHHLNLSLDLSLPQSSAGYVHVPARDFLLNLSKLLCEARLTCHMFASFLQVGLDL